MNIKNELNFMTEKGITGHNYVVFGFSQTLEDLLNMGYTTDEIKILTLEVLNWLSLYESKIKANGEDPDRADIERDLKI